MTTITIPKNNTKKENLVAIPKEEYLEYLQLRKAVPVVKMTPTEIREWKQAEKDYEACKFISLAQLKRELERSRKRKS